MSRRWIKRIGIALAVLLALLVLAGWWLLASQAGARFAIARAQSLLAGKLHIAQIHGSLSGPLQLDDVRYHDPASGIDVRIRRIDANYALTPLFHRNMLVHDLRINGLDVRLNTVTTPSATTPPTPLQSWLTPPLSILLDHASIRDAKFFVDAQRVFVFDKLDIGASWTGKALTVHRFALESSDGHATFSGALNSYSDYRGQASAQFDWKSTQPVAGHLVLNSNGSRATASIALTEPTPASAKITLRNQSSDLPWQLEFKVPAFDPAKLGYGGKIHSLALALRGSGDRHNGSLNGDIHVNAHDLVLDPLQFALQAHTLSISKLHLRAVDSPGELNARATLKLDQTPPAFIVDADWDKVTLPADLIGSALATQGQLHAQGNPQQFAAKGNLQIGPPDKPAKIAFQLDGTPKQVAISQFALRQQQGGLKASGTVTLQPQTSWNLQAIADNLDPADFAPDWPGAVDFDLTTTGKLGNSGAQGELHLKRLAGTLRRRKLHGSGDLQFVPPLSLKGNLKIAAGESSIALDGRSLTQTDVRGTFDITSLGDWLPKAGGSLKGNIDLRGTWPKLDAKGHVRLGKLEYAGVEAAAANLSIQVSDLDAPNGQIKLDAARVTTGKYLFDTVKLDAHGSQTRHTVSLRADGPQLKASLEFSGGLQDATAKAGGLHWRGTLSELTLAPRQSQAWTLNKPTAIDYANGAFTVPQSCLQSDQANLCVAASRTVKGDTRAEFNVHRLTLASIAAMISPESPLRLEGTIQASGKLSRTAGGAWTGQAKIESDNGSIYYPDQAQKPLLAYRKLTFDARLSQQSSTLSVRGDLDQSGSISGHIDLGAYGPNGAPLSGDISANLQQLRFVDLLNAQTSGTQGKLQAHMALSGTTANPGIKGNAELKQFTTELPAAGIRLKNGEVRVRSDNGRDFEITGSVASGDGKLQISGNISSDAKSPLSLKIKGERFQAADIPGAKVVVSPDLNLKRETGAYKLTGSMTIPGADVDAGKLPGAGAAQASPDVVVTDAQTNSRESSTPIFADITLKLGNGKQNKLDLRQGREVHLVSYGLNGYLSGQLAIQERPGNAATGRGQIVVNGTYKAYGQDLNIEQGRLLFAGTPVENPGLDIRATRSGFTDPTITVGLQVRGTAKAPILTVFSTPAMEQSDALSYLVAGKPMSQLKSGEGDAVGSAARALGTAGGDLLAKSIGNRMGLDDVGVSDNTAVGGAALTVGKYLSPRLYLSYGVGLFNPGEVVTLRYRLSRLFDLEIRNGTVSSRAGINYKIEK